VRPSAYHAGFFWCSWQGDLSTEYMSIGYAIIKVYKFPISIVVGGSEINTGAVILDCCLKMQVAARRWNAVVGYATNAILNV
jgi:hypothetical protein